MPLPGMSLVAFMDEPDALNYFRSQCVTDGATDEALRAWWLEARAALRPPAAKVGQPEILEIPSRYSGYLAGVPKNPRYATTVAGLATSFKLVEIAPLLAFQFHVQTDAERLPFRADTPNPPLDRVLRWCLPHSVPPVKVKREVVGNELRIISDDLNLALYPPLEGKDPSATITTITIGYGTRSPFVQVARFANHLYLKNGYHRAYALGKLGVTHIPCILVDATAWEQVVGPGEVAAFSLQLLESSNPPTCGHYLRGEAYKISLPLRRSVIRMSVSQEYPREEEW